MAGGGGGGGLLGRLWPAAHLTSPSRVCTPLRPPPIHPRRPPHVDEVRVDEQPVRRAQRRVVLEEHGRGHLRHIVHLRILGCRRRLGGLLLVRGAAGRARGEEGGGVRGGGGACTPPRGQPGASHGAGRALRLAAQAPQRAGRALRLAAQAPQPHAQPRVVLGDAARRACRLPDLGLRGRGRGWGGVEARERGASAEELRGRRNVPSLCGAGGTHHCSLALLLQNTRHRDCVCFPPPCQHAAGRPAAIPPLPPRTSPLAPSAASP